MKKVLILIMLAAVAFLYRDKINGWVASHKSNLPTFALPKELLDKISHDASLLPNPLRSPQDARNAHLTHAGTIQQTNVQRRSNGLPALKENAQLNKAAASKLADMFAQQYFEHVSPQGTAPADLADAAGYKYIIIGENLALGNFKDDNALVEAWMNSPGHRANILSTRYQEIGVAVGKGTFEGRQTWLAVQEFGTPQSACPSVDASLKKQIDANQGQLNSWTAQLEAMRDKLESRDYETREEYNRAVAEYNALVARFNALVDTTKEMVNKYNTQVNSLNDCIAK